MFYSITTFLSMLTVCCCQYMSYGNHDKTSFLLKKYNHEESPPPVLPSKSHKLEVVKSSHLGPILMQYAPLNIKLAKKYAKMTLSPPQYTKDATEPSKWRIEPLPSTLAKYPANRLNYVPGHNVAVMQSALRQSVNRNHGQDIRNVYYDYIPTEISKNQKNIIYYTENTENDGISTGYYDDPMMTPSMSTFSTKTTTPAYGHRAETEPFNLEMLSKNEMYLPHKPSLAKMHAIFLNVGRKTFQPRNH